MRVEGRTMKDERRSSTFNIQHSTFESLRMGLHSIVSNKFRSFLTILGIVIGVFAILVMQTVMEGLKGTIQEQIDVLGSDSFTVTKDAPMMNIEIGKHRKKHKKENYITRDEAETIDELAESVRSVTAFATQQWRINILHEKNRIKNTNLNGTMANWAVAVGFEIAEGRFFSEREEANHSNVVVIGNTIKEELFPFGSPIGKKLKINGIRYRIIGVFAERGEIIGQDQDNIAAIPLSKFENQFGTRRSLGMIVKAKSPELLEQAQDEVTQILRTIRKIPPSDDNNFYIATQETLSESINESLSFIYIIAVAIAAISLLVGGIGIMNIMLVSVTERTREIGIRKAIGAKKSNILWQFVFEAIVLGGVGGLIGVILGALTGVGIAFVFPQIPVSLPLWAVVLGISFSVFVGLISGFYPAYRASRLDPIEALRWE